MPSFVKHLKRVLFTRLFLNICPSHSAQRSTFKMTSNERWKSEFDVNVFRLSTSGLRRRPAAEMQCTALMTKLKILIKISNGRRKDARSNTYSKLGTGERCFYLWCLCTYWPTVAITDPAAVIRVLLYNTCIVRIFPPVNCFLQSTKLIVDVNRYLKTRFQKLQVKFVEIWVKVHVTAMIWKLEFLSHALTSELQSIDFDPATQNNLFTPLVWYSPKAYIFSCNNLIGYSVFGRDSDMV